MRQPFGKTLEDKANELASEKGLPVWDSSLPSILRREISLTVDQIRRLKGRHDYVFRKLLCIECDIGTDILQMEARQPPYMPVLLPEREKLKQRLFDIEKERRTLSLRLEDKTQSLEDKLLDLINKHEQFDI